MAGLILTAKALAKKLKEARDKQRNSLDSLIAQAQQMKSQNMDPRMSDYYTEKVANAIKDRDEFDWETWERRAITQITKEFRDQCKMAVALREIAMEEGLIKKQTSESGTPMLEDSPALGDRYALITIRPEPGTCLVYFEKAVSEFMERPWVLGAEWHFEQTGTDESTWGDGFHVHIVAKCKKSIRVTEITQCAAKDFECRHTIQIGNDRKKFLKTERDLEYALNYIRGDKHDEDKEDAVALNEEWRDRCGLQQVYYTRDWDNRESRPNAVIIEEVA